jgi:hypothetical protein
MTRLAKKLNCFAITAQSLSNYLTRRRPNVPKQFQIVDMPLLVLLETQPSSVWGIEHRLFKTRLVKKVAFCEPLEQQLFRYQVTRGEQSLETKVKGMLEQYNFKPQITLFFTSRTVNRHTGRLIWGRLTVEQKEQMADLTSGPMLVQEWDEDGWPMGYRVPLE